MKPRYQASPTLILLSLALLISLGVWAIPASHAQGQVQVTAAIPAATEQGTINLNVKVNGKGFKNGANAKWFVTGTTDTGGVTVNSTTFVSSTEVTANITVDDTADIANFDIQVTNSDGRGGKGTELFRVTAKGQAACPPMQPAPTGDTKCYAALPGCLDSTFGGLGFVYTDPDPEPFSNTSNAVVVQPDGKIVVAAEARSSATYKDFALIRYNADGTLDTSFGDPNPFNPLLRRGFTVMAVTTGGDYTRGLVLQPDGKIVVSGIANVNNNVVVRYNVDGTLDTTFGSGGIANLGSGSNREVRLQSDGKIVVGGTAAGTGFLLVRLNTNGSLDSSFGSGGQVTVNPTGAKKGTAAGWALTIQRVPAITGEERIILAGWSNISINSEWTLMRFRSNGATDTSFGTNGIVKTFFSGFGDQARKVQIDSSNRIVVAGFIRSASGDCGSYVSDFGVVRYTQNGSLDGSFGSKQIVDIYGGDDSNPSLALQADGKILLSGTGRSSDDTETHFALVRLNVDGSRDSSFGLLANGVVTTDLNGTESWAAGGVALQPTDGKIVVAGTAYLVPPFSEGAIFVARYLP